MFSSWVQHILSFFMQLIFSLDGAWVNLYYFSNRTYIYPIECCKMQINF